MTENNPGRRASPDVSVGFIAALSAMLILVPLLAFTVGGGAFLGLAIAAVGWGKAALGLGAGVGATVGLLLLIAWFLVFVVFGKDDKKVAEDGQSGPPGR
jgi:hypothetical protein